MGYCKIFPSGTVKVLEARLKKTKNSEELRRIQMVYYRAKYNYSPVKIAEMTGYAVETVHNIHSMNCNRYEQPSPIRRGV